MSGENDDDLLTVDIDNTDAEAVKKDPIEDFKEQAERLQREKDEADAARRRAEHDASNARREVEQARSQIADTQVDAIGNAIAAEQAAISAAERDLEAAFAEGDYGKAAKLQSTLSMAAAKLTRLQENKEDAETRKAAPADRSQQRSSSGDPVEDYIATAVPPGRSQAWLREHKECLTDPRKNARMMAAHHEALADGIKPDTDDYFAHIETKLGYRGGATEADKPAPRKPDAPNYAAPPSRETPGARPNANRITLTRAQADMADSLGMTKAEYAKHLIDLQREGKMT